MRTNLLRDAAFYLAAVLFLGTAANLFPSRHIAWLGKGIEPPQAGVDFTTLDPVSVDALRTSLPAVIILDTRSAEEHAIGHIPGAQTIAFTELDRDLTPDLLARLRRADAVVIYGVATETDIEQLLAQQLRRRGLSKPYILMGGFPGWQATGLPEEGRSQ